MLHFDQPPTLWDALNAMPHGAPRRAAIVARLKENMTAVPKNNQYVAKSILVNLRHTPQLDQDADLRKLLKSGVLKRVRCYTTISSACTKLILA